MFVVSQEAECKKEMMDVKFQADTKMADSKRELELQKAAFNQEVNTKVGTLRFESTSRHVCVRAVVCA